MDSKRIALLTVAICAIGIFALPGTVSLFSGQHSWYDLSAPQNDVPCEKCHQDIADEMISDGSDGNGVHRKLTCSMCHRTPFNNYSYGSGYGDGSTPGKEAHAAAVVQCMDCHEHNVSKPGYDAHMTDPAYNAVGCFGLGHPCHKTFPIYLGAGGFGLTDYPDDTGERAAHLDFVNDSIDDPLMEGANEACIACHTRIGVNITWTKSTTLHFNANETHDGTWIIDDFTAHGQNETFSTYKNNWTNSY